MHPLLERRSGSVRHSGSSPLRAIRRSGASGRRRAGEDGGPVGAGADRYRSLEHRPHAEPVAGVARSYHPRPMDLRRDGFRISDDSALLDVELIHSFLRGSYWAAGIPREVVERSLRGSLCFGLYEGDAQVGFARCVTDRATYAYLADVFVLPSHRGRGLSKWLMECVLAHPDLELLRRWSLVTRDAHGLYARYGFVPLRNPERYLEKVDPDVYARRNQ